MAYKPNQIGEEERSRYHNLMWLASAASVLKTANALIGVVFSSGNGFAVLRERMGG